MSVVYYCWGSYVFIDPYIFAVTVEYFVSYMARYNLIYVKTLSTVEH